MTEATFVHPQALCESTSLGSGTRVWAFAVVQAGSTVGAGCNVCSGAFVESGAVIGDRVTIKNNVAVWDGVQIGNDAFLGPNATFTNDLRPRAHQRMAAPVPTVVANGATIGANATIVAGVHIGAHALVGAGAVVTRDVAPHALVRGNPAHWAGWVCVCAALLTGSGDCAACGRRYAWSGGPVLQEVGK